MGVSFATRRQRALERDRLFDKVTGETFREEGGIWLKDDFLGAALSGIWDISTIGIGTETDPALVADAVGGQVAVALNSTSEEQDAGIYWGDQLLLQLNKKLVFETRLSFQTIPTGTAEVVFGLVNDYVKAKDGATKRILFVQDGNAALTVNTDDGSTDSGQVATGITLTAGTFYVFRIEVDDTGSVKFYINGNRVAATTTFVMTAAATDSFQPYLYAYKASGTGVAEARADYIAIAANRT